MKRLALLLVLPAIAGCASETPRSPSPTKATTSYTLALQAALLRSCEAFGSNPTVCGCALHHAEASIPITQIGRDELELEYGTLTEEAAAPLGRLITHCAGQQALAHVHEEEANG